MVDTARRDSSTGEEVREPAQLGDLNKRSWLYILRRTVSAFREDQCTDLAAALTYYAVLALFPGLLAVVSILGLVGANNEKVRSTILDVFRPLVDSTTLDTIRTLIDQLSSSQAGGYALALGIAGALWSASAYVGAFGRAMNRVYGVPEGRPFWKLRPLQVLITVITVALCIVGIFILIISGPVARSVGDALTIGDTALQVWNIAKWPVLAIVVCLAVALLFYMTPNVRQPRFRWVSPGAFVAIIVWVAASVGFAFYVGNFSSYNRTYGSLAAVIIALLWLWLTNLALMFGAELDAELERGRELQAGMPAEESLQLPLRDDSGVVKAERKRREEVAEGRDLRQDAESESSDFGPPRQPVPDED